MSESVGSEHPVPPIAAAAETTAQAVCFEGTEIPKLTLAGDADWLIIVAEGSRTVDELYIAALNKQAEIAQDSVESKASLFAETRRLSWVSLTNPASPEDIEGRARIRFYRQLLTVENPAQMRTGVEVAAVRHVLPSKMIALTRLLYRHVGERLDQVLITGRHLYKDPTLIAERFAALTAAGIDPAAVVLASPNTFTGSHALAGGESFFAVARKAEARYRKREATAAANLGAIVVPERAEVPVVEIVNPGRYAQLAAITGMDVGLLENGLPQLGALDAQTYGTVVSGAEALADSNTDRELRLRDVAPLIPKLTDE